jgi:hypothetical protein
MKTLTATANCFILSLYFSFLNSTRADVLKLPGDSVIQDSIGVGPQEPAFTPEELAVPPVGEIQKLYLRTVNELRGIMTARLAALPPGDEGQGSPWFIKFQAFKMGLDAVATSRRQSDCIALVPQMAELLTAREGGKGVPEFAQRYSGWVTGFGTVLINAIERHIIDENATVTAANLTNFIKVFSITGFVEEGEAENELEEITLRPGPVAVMILDPAVVVAQLKAQPWQNADRFLGAVTSAEAFVGYENAGTGLAVLKTKYAANKAAIIAKWDELAAWVAQQRGTD